MGRPKINSGPCMIDDCEKPAKYKKMCRMHYARNYRHGDPLFSMIGGGCIKNNGYHAIGGKKRFVHRLKAEGTLGRSLPNGVVIHHVNGSRASNENNNLVICQDEGYHRLLHTRTRALMATGDVHKRKCHYCKEYDDTFAMHTPPADPNRYYHRECARKYGKDRHARRALDKRVKQC